MRRAVAVRIPIVIARFRYVAGRPAAARAMTTALSPASTRSIMMTWIKVVTASLVIIVVNGGCVERSANENLDSLVAGA